MAKLTYFELLFTKKKKSATIFFEELVLCAVILVQLAVFFISEIS